MKYMFILILSCSFALFLAPAAQASEFTGNTCHEEGANCQTQSDWMTGWCEAASAAGVVDQTVEECKQSVGANHPDTQVVSTQSQNRAQNQNSSASSSEQSNGGAERAGTPDRGSGRSGAAEEQCQRYRVMRTDPGRLVCVRPRLASAPDSDGTPFNPIAPYPRPDIF